MKIEDLKIKSIPITIDKKNEFILVPWLKTPYLNRYLGYLDRLNCYIITIHSDRKDHRQFDRVTTYVYKGNLPPFSKWYSFPSLPTPVRLVLYFYSHKNEVFTSAELSSIFTDLSKSAIKSILSVCLNYKIVFSTRKYFWGHEQGLKKLERYFIKNKIPYRRIKNANKKFIITIKRGNKERHFTYSY